MINSFGTLYQGQVNMEGVGYDGTPSNDRRYPNDKLIEAFGTATEVAKLVDRLGYDIFWMAEHHFQREGYECIPNILMLSLHLADRSYRWTKHIRADYLVPSIVEWHN